MTKQETIEFVQKAYEYFGIKYESSPLEEIEINSQKIYLKRDDKLILGCSKQRSIIPFIYSFLQKGNKKFVISSSGNAGLVSAFCAMNSNEIDEMIVLLSKNISDTKFTSFIEKTKLEVFMKDMIGNGFKKDNLTIKLVDDPRQEAFTLGKNGYVNLRGSTEEEALIGFETISYELDEQLNQIDEVFVPASSGTTFVGIYEGFNKIRSLPKFNAVQTTKTIALIKNLIEVESTIYEEIHPAESIVDIIGHRRIQIERIIKETNGQGYAITAKEVVEAHQMLEYIGIKTSYDSALTLAAYLKSESENANNVLVFTG